MSLIKRSEWPSSGGSLLSNFFDDDRFFTSPWLRGQEIPAMNVRETDNNFEVELAVPGYKKEDFNVSVDNGILTISAERKQENEKKDDNYTRKEFSCSSFSRSFRLPEHVDQESIKANFKDGVLNLMIDKTDRGKVKQSKTIPVS
jgi:HSP20 family protein